MLYVFLLFNDTATTEIYTYEHTLSLHDALPIFWPIGNPLAKGTPQRVDNEIGVGRPLERAVHIRCERFRSLDDGSPVIIGPVIQNNALARKGRVEEFTAKDAGEPLGDFIGDAVLVQEIGRASCRERVGQYG